MFLFLISFSSSVLAALPKGIIEQNGRPAPALKLNDMDGEAYDIASAKGRWIFVHFWASWCGPCRRELPTIQTLSHQLDSKKWEIVIINTAEDEDTVFSFVSSVAPDFVPLLDRDGLVTERWKARGLPSTYLVDPQGHIRYVALGGRPWNQKDYIEFLKTLANK